MSITANTPTALQAILDTVHALVDMGMPVFTARLSGGDPILPKRWQMTEPDHDLVDKWRPGLALCGVTGTAFDVIDIDPRNGGIQGLEQLNADLGDEGPEVYWEVATPSGGAHLYISPLGIGKHQSFLPGVDLQGGNADGSSRGFVFLPPTVRPSRGRDAGVPKPYRPVRPLYEPGEADRNFRIYVQKKLSAKVTASRPGAPGISTQRPARETLRAACLKAEAGEQRSHLLKYVHELERIGYAPDDIIELLKVLVSDMPAYGREPWYPARTGDRDKHLRALLHAPGVVVPDATTDELGMLTPRVAASGLTSYANTLEALIKWIWSGYLAVGDITIIDADEGVGKSLITVDVAARMSRGLPMPGCSTAIADKGNVLFLAPEDRPEVARMRLQAAGADIRMVYRPELIMKGKKGARKAHLGSQILTFPEGLPQLQQWIESYEIKLLVIDPITAFLDEKINSHNDASVRRALEPLSIILAEIGCAGLMIRHLNKDKKQDIKLRGTGSRAFSAVSRVHLFANELPPDVGVQATHGLAQLKASNRKRIEEVLTYSIRDSNIPIDDEGNMVPAITWHGLVELSSFRMAQDGGAKRGPDAVAQEEIAQVLEAMFGVKSDWSAEDALKELAAAIDGGVNEATVKKVRARIGIRSYAVWKPGGGVQSWRWTTEKQRVGRRRG